MQPLTEKQTQRVWSRVMNAQAVPAAGMTDMTTAGETGQTALTPEKLLELIAGELGITIAKAYGVATFFENFSLEAKGKHIVKVCNGTACHVRKSQPIYDAVRAHLGLTGKHKTTDDGIFTLETVACLGACGLAPVMTIDGEVHAKMDPDKALALLDEIRAKEVAAE